MRIGLYFGSFNPIHQGHLIISEQALKHPEIDEVWFVVSPQNPFKKESQLLNARNRLHLVRLAIEDAEKIRVSDIEFGLPKPSYTANTLQYLQEKYPSHVFHLIIGGDGFQNIERWKNADYILKNHKIFIYRRPGDFIPEVPGATIEFITGPLLQISSSFIRFEIGKNNSIRFLLPEAVRIEIMNNNFYKGSYLDQPT